jgi:hypothetical protein
LPIALPGFGPLVKLARYRQRENRTSIISEAPDFNCLR